ncbi:MAG TPA: signal peptidase II [Turneriella sp.]|nr:signal peptidase II [Turneriella sp.]HMY10853.1 signal peptidase II [Turneriella sp.]HNA78471.1 signal peptidase II [Turneriella sp.]HNE18326.1 signal peptidase II [Turneriella sp.]HNJ65237.1 signal peptidase II [Turneriella sp.]
MSRWRTKFTPLFLTVLGVVYISDLLSKLWILKKLGGIGQSETIISNFLYFTLTRNEGGVFGMMQGHAWLFQILTGFAIIFLLYYYYKTPETSLIFSLAIAAILGGALGNFTDRFYGTTPGVVDFIDIRLGSFRWFIFNIADAFICVGAFLLAIAFYQFEKAEKAAAAAAQQEKA